MTAHDSASLEAHVLGQIRAASVDREPFPHFIVDALLPEDFYAEAIAAIPDTTSLQRVSYPGTGYGRRTAASRDYGFAFPELRKTDGPLGVVRDIFASELFSRCLLDKFADAIPPVKHRHFADGAADYSTVFDLQIDLPGYAIAPHPDIESKIVTFQLYLSSDDSLADQGTFLCKPKDGRAARGRVAPARALGRVVEAVTKPFGDLAARVERSKLGETAGIGAQRQWLPWSWFDVAKVSPALPNHFLAFAPNERSYHAVTMDGLAGERAVIRGFIRAGADTSNWIAPKM